MLQLHMHVISQDFDSPALKKKQHWNGFTSDFFLPLAKVEAEVEKLGRVESKAALKTLLERPLVCHKCDHKPKNMPELKKHLLSHLVS